jgi:L,D-peptidoglycan transpeptidase YkuD (ErfK/YbiS/YcfS/YnhG family)
MGFRFHKRIKILPGVWLNFGKSGISASVGVKGLTVNIKDGKARTTVGIQGTGLSYSETSTSSPGGSTPERPFIPAWVWLVVIAVLALAFILR